MSNQDELIKELAKRVWQLEEQERERVRNQPIPVMQKCQSPHLCRGRSSLCNWCGRK